MSDCCLMPSEQFFFAISWQWWCPLCTRPTHLVGFYSASSLKQQSVCKNAKKKHLKNKTYSGSTVFIFFSTLMLVLVLSIITLEPQLTYNRLSLDDTSIHLTISFSLPGDKHIGIAWYSCIDKNKQTDCHQYRDRDL